MFHSRGYAARCCLEGAVSSVEHSERATRSAPGRRRSTDAELWHPCESDVAKGPGTESGRCAYFPGCALLLPVVDKGAMDAKRTFIPILVFLAPLSFLVAQEKNSKGASSVQSELEAVKAELKAQEDKIEQLSQEIAKLSELIKESEANKEKAASEKSPSATPPKATAVSPTPTPPATVGVENPSPSETGGTRSHVVAKGETLSQIAKQYGVTVDEIQKANNIQDAKKLQIGQTIKIPGSGSPSPTP
jgi:LysM repeat protein